MSQPLPADFLFPSPWTWRVTEPVDAMATTIELLIDDQAIAHVTRRGSPITDEVLRAAKYILLTWAEETLLNNKVETPR